MTTPPPIPPEAMDGRECLVKVKIGDRLYTATYGSISGEWFTGGGYFRADDVLWAVPLSWCRAAPGMREALKLIATDLFTDYSGEETIDKMRAIARDAIARCNGGE